MGERVQEAPSSSHGRDTGRQGVKRQRLDALVIWILEDVEALCLIVDNIRGDSFIFSQDRSSKEISDSFRFK